MRSIKIYPRYVGFLLGLLILTLAGCGGGGKDYPADVSTQAQFVGATNCSQCHTATYDDWLDTPHALARANLPSADRDNPVCLQCHNTTQNPLDGVQCEACHGPGGLHFGIGPIELSYQETVCQDCHTNEAALSASHSEVYPQWAMSGHADELAAAWQEFSDEATGTRKSTYPIEMSNSSDGNFVCFQCHNGIGSLSYIKDTILTPAATTVEENATAECATCHNPHQETATKTNALGDVTTTKHVRLPEALSFNTSVPSSVPSVNRVFTFLDGSEIPPRIGNSLICLFCHQGRSSGFILNTRRFGPATKSFENDHYLAAGAVLWGRNGYEYLNRSYTRDIAHNNDGAAVDGNCVGCHMNNSNTGTEGGHTWKMVSEAGVENVAACNAPACHNGAVTAFESFTINNVDHDGDGTIAGVAEEIGGINLDPVTGAPIDGLLGALVVTIENAPPNGFKYLPTSYPYFFRVDGVTRPTSGDWTDVTLAVAFNLNMLFKTVKQDSPLPGGGFKGAVNVHNPYYTIQLLVDSLESLEATARSVLPETQVDLILANRPSFPTDDPARDYGSPDQLSLP
ncbi:MAG: hypothetical protein GTO13_09890 [Proteobacteria bacterium]|nr:hypothetical protein [Pseudomonadota bacterium]